ncbi:hypothetical protein DFA_10222 [Cavenderia fasciculata]|uniref:Methyltransferase domain-containing protein n=1 Tax=Cavenderia fasciculata TaxID=261658 RepID=F4Q9L9_CACFS|nr:uncharacterized protein DFA_10222 [Cavenderia fasciculata]EGG15388.1 hypothetical protein DFA_10222 [Cavenderia fasciculata]|eukprot:XP_004354130.1 hypothetical protein DFA_10222 [Cavenderia fasciculata]
MTSTLQQQQQQSSQDEFNLPQTSDMIEDRDLKFISDYLKESDKDALRQHVFKVWSDCITTAHAYRCIKSLSFLYPKIHRHYIYEKEIAQSSAKSSLQFLDLGCCFATDTRQLVRDGVPPSNIVAIDVVPDYWQFGTKLYKDADTLGVESRFGNTISDQSFASDLNNTRDYVWTGLVLHVLTKQDVEGLLRRVYGFLKSGGTYFGTCVGSEVEQVWIPNTSSSPRYLHSDVSLTALLTTLGFKDVKVQSYDSKELQMSLRQQNAAQTQILEWKADGNIQKRILVFSAKK